MTDRPCMHTFAYDSYSALDKCRCGHYCSDHDRPPVPFDYESAYKSLAAKHHALIAGLTPDEVRVITGLVRAMRDDTMIGSPKSRDYEVRDACAAMEEARECAVPGMPPAVIRSNVVDAAWHIAHAISQMGES